MKLKDRFMKIFYIDIKSLEWFLSLLGVAWGLWIAAPGHALTFLNPLVHSELILGLWMALVNAVKLYYVFKGGRLSWRRFLIRSLNNITWLVILISFLYANPTGSGIPVYAVLFITTSYITIRSGLEEWVR